MVIRKDSNLYEAYHRVKLSDFTLNEGSAFGLKMRSIRYCNYLKVELVIVQRYLLHKF